MRPVQVKNLSSAEAFLAHLNGLGAKMPFSAAVDPLGALAQPKVITDAGAGHLVVPNRFAILPMEGWDAASDGAPTDLVRRRWQRFGDSGAGLVWAEATAVVPAGRANPNQLVLNEQTAEGFAELRSLFASTQIVGLQLTHSGRYARPLGQAEPHTAYVHPHLDDAVGASERHVLSDNQLDELVASFVHAAVLASQAGFHFVDVKACHGYLGHELLSAYDRPGRYGGDLAGRTLFLRSVIAGIRDAAPQLAIGLRLSLFDTVPYVAGDDGIGQPRVQGPYRFAFGASPSGLEIDLDETHQVIEMVSRLGLGLLSATAGSPYYCPHVQRPAFFPPSDGYKPPEDPLVGVARQLGATAAVAHRHPGVAVVGAGYSYLQEWLPHVGQAVVEGGDASFVGLGRMALSYPNLPADILGGRPLERRLICRTFSDCTTAPRSGLISGCFPIDQFYKQHPQRVELAAAKKHMRRGA